MSRLSRSVRVGSRLVSLLAVLLLLAAGCGGNDSPTPGAGTPTAGATGTPSPTAAAQPEPGGSVSIGLEAESAGWMPGKDSHSESGTSVMLAIHDPLMARTDNGEVKPFLAESLTPNAELTEWTLKLRSGVKFHDGTDLNSAALKEIFDTYLKAPTSRLAGALAPVDAMEIVDDLTVRYKLKSKFAPFADLLTGAAGWPFSPTAAKAKGDDYSASPVGTGPVVFDSWQRDNQLVVKKNPNYWIPGQPYLDQVTFRPIPDEDARLASLTSGGVDMIHTLRQSLARKALATSGFTHLRFLGNNSGATIFNTGKPPFDDKRVRLALAHSIKQEDLIKVLGGEGLTPPVTQLFSKDDPFFSPEAEAKWPKFDLEKAKGFLQQYVNDPNRSDKKPVGQPISFTYNCPPDPSLIEVAVLYQQFWTQLGAQVELKQVEQSAHINNGVGKPPDFKGEYDAQCWRLGGQADPDAVLFNQYGKPAGQAANVTDWDNPKAQELLKTGRETNDLATRKKAYGDLMVLFAEEVPHLLTGGTLSVVSTKPTVKGVPDWTFPDGKTKGNGHPQSVVVFRGVWLDK